MKINPEMESKFQRLTAYRKQCAADFGLVMPESELRQCRGGRQILAAIKRAERDQKRQEKLFAEVGRESAKFLDSLVRQCVSGHEQAMGGGNVLN